MVPQRDVFLPGGGVMELKPCPFCGGKAKISTRDVRFIGWNAAGGSKKIKCAAQVICNICKARGPVFTAALINPYDRVCQESEAYKWMVGEAAEAWNWRADGERKDGDDNG